MSKLHRHLLDRHLAITEICCMVCIYIIYIYGWFWGSIDCALIVRKFLPMGNTCNEPFLHSLYMQTVSTIEQVYPRNVKYCCHCPNIKLGCTFSKNPFAASWTVLVDGIFPQQLTLSTPGHKVDASEVQSGSLFLHINDTMYSANNSYSCTAVYTNGAEEFSNVFSMPMVEG